MKTYLLYHQPSHSVNVSRDRLPVRHPPHERGHDRSRRKLLLVGDSSTLCRHPFFGELLAYVKGGLP